jgi:hypothetical protein
VSSDRGARGWWTGDDDRATQEQRHAGWRSTYIEHGIHVRHLAHVPCTDGLIEGIGTLHRSEGRAAVWSERRSRSEGTGDDDDTAMQEQRHAGWRSTYVEHAPHVRHRAHVPISDGLIEGVGKLQCSERRATVWSEGRSRSEGTGNGRRRRHSDTRSATRGMEEHVHRTCHTCSSPCSRPNQRWAD